jgi:hypothetical protein
MDSSTTIQQRLKVSELVGFILLLILVVTGPLFLPSSMHYFRLLVGLFFWLCIGKIVHRFRGKRKSGISKWFFSLDENNALDVLNDSNC